MTRNAFQDELPAHVAEMLAAFDEALPDLIVALLLPISLLQCIACDFKTSMEESVACIEYIEVLRLWEERSIFDEQLQERVIVILPRTLLLQSREEFASAHA